jgi:hypothetical protein
MGLLAQSIGGGGGNAGTALAKSFAAAGDPQFPTVQFSTAVGGKGGSGGAGGTVNVSTTGALTTAGSSAFGLLAQSIGGGGGNGADSTAGGTVAAGKAGGLQLNTAIGGSGSKASGGGSVTVANASTSATIRTSGDNATALLAQSIGGGGGNGGGGNANSAAPNLAAAGVSAGFVLGISTAVGGTAGGGGGGGKGTGRGKGATHTPDGRAICFRYNSAFERCRGPCSVVHVCRTCFGNHPAHACPGANKSGATAEAAATAKETVRTLRAQAEAQLADKASGKTGKARI